MDKEMVKKEKLTTFKKEAIRVTIKGDGNLILGGFFTSEYLDDLPKTYVEID